MIELVHIHKAFLAMTKIRCGNSIYLLDTYQRRRKDFDWGGTV